MNGKQARVLRKTAADLTSQRTYREVNVQTKYYPTGFLGMDGKQQMVPVRTCTIQNIGQRAVYLGLKQSYNMWARNEA